MKTFTAAGVYTDGSNYPETGSFAVTTWASLNPTYANNLAGDNVFTGLLVGSATVTATTGSIVGTSTLYVVERVLTSIAVTADNATLAHGLSQQYTATGTYSDNTTGTTSISNVTGDVHWTVTGPATITNSGYLTTTGVGAVVVTAHIYDLPIATANLNVTDKELVRIVVTPAEAQVAKGWRQDLYGCRRLYGWKQLS